MEFDPFGDVLACCANALYPLGNVARSSLRSIWEGARAATLRDALRDHDLSFGCSVCRHRLTYGHGDLPRDYYDNFPLPEGDPEWPHSLQFSLHNTCNLSCVMCGGDRSSSIRSRRDGLPPLPRVYGERFFEELPPFLEHSGAVDFSGGEPFLVPEHHRVWDLLIQMPPALRPLCSLTTNGTVWNAKVERVLDEIDCHISVSVDAMTASTFEAIRVGARRDEVFANLERFLAYTRSRGTILTLSWSLMRQNWSELGAAMRFADERGIQVRVNTVIDPEYGVQRLPTDELRRVVESLEAESVTLAPELELNRPMWLREVGRLREELDLRSTMTGLRPLTMEPAGPHNARHVVEMVLQAGDRRVLPDAVPALVSEARADLQRWCGPAIGHIRVTPDGHLASVRLDGVLDVGFDADGAGPATLVDLVEAVVERSGGSLLIAEESPEGDRLVQTLCVGRPVRDKDVLVVRLVSIADGDGTTVLVGVDSTLVGSGSRVETPVALGPARPPLGSGS